MRSLARIDDIPQQSDERTILLQLLPYVVETVVTKIRGLTEAQARPAPLPASPPTSPDGATPTA